MSAKVLLEHVRAERLAAQDTLNAVPSRSCVPVLVTVPGFPGFPGRMRAVVCAC